MTEESVFVGHEPCPKCGSSDALAVYSSGVRYCYSCKDSTASADGAETPGPTVGRVGVGGLLVPTFAGGLPARRLTEDTCKRWGYGYTTHNGEPVHVATYYAPSGEAVAQKIRTADKGFSWIGDSRAAEPLYGMGRWRDRGKKVVITEGEIDCLTVSQIQYHKWPVVSLKDGAGSAARGVKAALEWLERFDEVILMFDQDSEGRKAVESAASVLSPGKAKVARLELKDANALLQAGRGSEIVDAIFGARVWSPDGVLSGADLWEKVTAAESAPGIPYPWASWNRMLRGIRLGEILMVAAGAGIGKSTLCREIALQLMRAGEKVGWIALEEGVRTSVLRFLGMTLERALHLESVDWEALKPAWEERLSDHLVVYSHCGSVATDRLLSRIRFMVKGQGCRFVVLDHVTMAISGREDADDRKDIDVLMSGLRALVEETGCGMVVVSHLKRRGPNAPALEDGGVPRLSDLRGSAALEQIPDAVVVLARNQAQGATMAAAYVLKSRFTGLTGLIGSMEYVFDTGRYREVELFNAA